MSLIPAIKFTFFPNISFCVLAAKEKAKWDRVWIMINMEEVSASPPGGGGGGGGGGAGGVKKNLYIKKNEKYSCLLLYQHVRERPIFLKDRRPPRSTPCKLSGASDVFKGQVEKILEF